MRWLMPALRRETATGAVAGLLGGLVFTAAMLDQGLGMGQAGLFGASASGTGAAIHLPLAAVAGAAFGLLVGYRPNAYAAATTLGVVFGLLLWIVGPLTLRPIAEGLRPSWSVEQATAAFPSLIGHLVYGAVTGVAFHLLTSLARVIAPPRECETPAAAPARGRVVIVGGGFGGMAAAQRLESLFPRGGGPEVTLISRSNYLVFTPMLAEVASSGLEAQHISAPIRAACPHTRFRHAHVEAIDLAEKAVTIRVPGASASESLPYDHLMLAMGAIPNFFGLPGLAEHASTLKTLEDAIRLRNRVLQLLELADVEPDGRRRRRLLTFVVAGGGFAGTETIAELLDLVRSVRRFYPGIEPQDARFVLVHSRDRILPELSPELGAYALDKLRMRGIEFLLGRRVAGARAGGVVLDDGTEIPTHALVWTAGNQPHPLLKTLSVELNRGGQVVADSTLRVQGLADVWAVGDGAQIPDLTSPGRFCPPTAQHALREGRVGAGNIVAALNGRPLEEFRFRAIGSLVALGHRTAAAEIRGRKFSGLMAWFMWRAVYLSKLPGLERKVRVLLDWGIDLLFPRDIVLTSADPAPPSVDRGSVEIPADSGAASEPGAEASGP